VFLVEQVRALLLGFMVSKHFLYLDWSKNFASAGDFVLLLLTCKVVVVVVVEVVVVEVVEVVVVVVVNEEHSSTCCGCQLPSFPHLVYCQSVGAAWQV